MSGKILVGIVLLVFLFSTVSIGSICIEKDVSDVFVVDDWANPFVIETPITKKIIYQNQGTVVNERTGKTYHWINEAIDDFDTIDGDTILVHNPDLSVHPTGKYIDNILIG